MLNNMKILWLSAKFWKQASPALGAGTAARIHVASPRGRSSDLYQHYRQIPLTEGVRERSCTLDHVTYHLGRIAREQRLLKIDHEKGSIWIEGGHSHRFS